MMLTSSFLPIKCVLFDLDGTLLDTAPDLLAALNAVLVAEGREHYTLAQARHTVSHGSKGMLELAFGMDQTETELHRRRRVFLDYYQANISRYSCLFDAMPDVLACAGSCRHAVGNRHQQAGIPDLFRCWMRWICVTVRAALLVAIPWRLPSHDPEPLLLAAEQCGAPLQHCLYVGDAERDIIAGRNAGMTTLIAAWGYLNANDEHLDWQADGIIATPAEILGWLS